jgi:hypothetical protein
LLSGECEVLPDKEESQLTGLETANYWCEFGSSQKTRPAAFETEFGNYALREF